MTENIPKEYQKISFTLEEDEDEGEDGEEKDNRETLPSSSANNQLGQKRTRAARSISNMKDKISIEESIKKS